MVSLRVATSFFSFLSLSWYFISCFFNWVACFCTPIICCFMKSFSSRVVESEEISFSWLLHFAVINFTSSCTVLLALSMASACSLFFFMASLFFFMASACSCFSLLISSVSVNIFASASSFTIFFFLYFSCNFFDVFFRFDAVLSSLNFADVAFRFDVVFWRPSASSTPHICSSRKTILRFPLPNWYLYAWLSAHQTGVSFR